MTTITITIDAGISLQDNLHAIRHRFHKHEDIVTLGGARLEFGKDVPEAWIPEVHNLLEQIVDELGNCAEDSWIGARNAIQNGPYLATCPTITSLHNALTGHPAICLAAGPTAQALMPKVAELASTHFIFCADAMSDACRSFSFVPQFTCLLERTRGNFDMVKDSAGNGSRLIAPPSADPGAAEAFGGKCLWWLGADMLDRWLAPGSDSAYAGRSCGALSVAAALVAGCNPIYLVGHDLAYDGERSHAESVHAMAPKDHAETRIKPHGESHIYHMRRIQVPASKGGTVESCGLFSIFRADIESMLSAYPFSRVINCGGLSEIKGTVNGALPEPWRQAIARASFWPGAGLKDWSKDIPRIIENTRRIRDRCYKTMVRLELDANTSAIAEDMAISTMVDHDLVLMFNYVFRTLNNNLNLRMQFRVRHGADPDKETRKALRFLASTMDALCQRMEADLA